MRSIQSNLKGGVNYFGTGTTNSPEFIKFSERFNRSFKKELNKIGATDLVVSSGHFYLSGFFTIKNQSYYFSISDVRHNQVLDYNNKVQMLVRKCDSYNDFKGHANRYVTIETNMSKEILQVFNLPKELFKVTKNKVNEIENTFNKCIQDKDILRSVSSGKKASKVIFKLLEYYNSDAKFITEIKSGRYLKSVSVEAKEFNAYYCGIDKIFRFYLK